MQIQSFSPYVSKLFLKNFLPRLKIFWEPSSQVPILFAALKPTLTKLGLEPSKRHENFSVRICTNPFAKMLTTDEILMFPTILVFRCVVLHFKKDLFQLEILKIRFAFSGRVGVYL